MSVADVGAGLGRLLSGVPADVATLIRTLPEIAGHLAAIRAATAHMDDEVTGMHAAVEALRGEVRELRGEVRELDAHVAGMAGDVGEMTPNVVELTRVLHPFRRRGR